MGAFELLFMPHSTRNTSIYKSQLFCRGDPLYFGHSLPKKQENREGVPHVSSRVLFLVVLLDELREKLLVFPAHVDSLLAFLPATTGERATLSIHDRKNLVQSNPQINPSRAHPG